MSKRVGVMVTCLAAAALVACGGGRATTPAAAPGPGVGTLALTSPAFAAGGEIPRTYTCDGDDVSPPLEREAPPPGTRSLALIMDDPDAPVGT